MLGARERRVTIRSQQVRALNLVWALHSTGRLDNRTLAIIGGGFAGLTAAAAAIRLGANPRLFEREAKLAGMQHGCDHRRVHPNLFDWPRDDAIEPNAALPVLNWTANSAGNVREQILTAWTEFSHRIELHSSTSASVSPEGLLRYEHNGLPISKPFDNVIVAVGMGFEVDFGDATQGYWHPDGLERYLPTGGRRRSSEIVVIGNGDGGIIDALRAALGDPQHPLLDWVEDTVLPRVPCSLKRDLMILERELALLDEIHVPKATQADHRDRASRFLENRYRDILLGGLEALEAAVKPRKRVETSVRLVGRTATPFHPDAAPLNRFLLALLIRCDRGEALFRYDLHEPRPTPDVKLIHRTGTQKDAGEIPKVLAEAFGEVAAAITGLNYDAPRIEQFPPTYFDARPVVQLESDISEAIQTAPLHVPLIAEDFQRFERLGHLDSRMRRRGPFGFGHYAFVNERDAHAHVGWLLGDEAHRHVLARLALPTALCIAWSCVGARSDWPPEAELRRWVAQRGERVQACHDVVTNESGYTSQAYCFYDENVGAPHPELGPI